MSHPALQTSTETGEEVSYTHAMKADGTTYITVDVTVTYANAISGGNIDVNILNRVITRGLVMSGRKANLTIALEDKPGQLKKVAEIVSRCGSNVVSVQHDGSDPNMPISSCFLKLTLETRDAAQIEQIRTELTKAGFQLVTERV